MDFVKAQYERIRQQLDGLSASQRMLTVTLLVIMGITLMYWVRYAGRPEMEALLEQPMAAEDVARIREKLQARGMRFEVSGDRVLVPSDRKQEVLAGLYFDQAMPSNTTAAWDAIVGKLNSWNSEKQNAQWWLQAKQAKLAEMMRSWPGVSDANVIIDATTRAGFTNAVKPSATINLKTRDGVRSGKKLATAAADMVAGAQAGLERGQIRVAINGVSFSVLDAGGDSLGGADDLADVRQRNEAYYAEKIAQHLGWLNARVFVSVAVDVNNKSTQEQSTTYDPKGMVKVETKIKSRTNEELTDSGQSGEPGVGANLQGSIGDAEGGGAKQSRNDNEEETDFQSGLSSRLVTSREGPGRATVVMATVRVPHSYFVRVYKEWNPGTKDPDESMLAPYLERELAKIRADVKSCTALKDDSAVAVETYSDSVLALVEGPAGEREPGAGGAGLGGVVGGHGKEIALATLAVMSLLMMTMMVRKGSPAPVAVHIPAAPGPVPQLAAGEEVVGEAGDGETVLGGMELDEDAAQTQQMLGQVSDLVKENPEAAANLIKRWMNK